MIKYWNGKFNAHSPFQTPYLESTVSHEPLGAAKTPRLASSVRIRCHTIGKRLGDCDGRSIKAVLDALVRGGILKSDSYESVKEVCFTQEYGEEDQTIITINKV